MGGYLKLYCSPVYLNKIPGINQVFSLILIYQTLEYYNYFLLAKICLIKYK